MGYNLHIGEAEADIVLKDRYARIYVKGLELPESPLNSTDVHTNYCWPSYTGWHDFCWAVGLEKIFYADARGCEKVERHKDEAGNQYSGLLCQHPGAVALTPEHLRLFQEAKDKYYATLDPEWRRNDEMEYNKRRLDWLVWWTDWALKNCQYPTFYNS